MKSCIAIPSINCPVMQGEDSVYLTISDVMECLTVKTTVMNETVKYTASRMNFSVIMDQTGEMGAGVFLSNSYVTGNGIVQVEF